MEEKGGGKASTMKKMDFPLYRLQPSVQVHSLQGGTGRWNAMWAIVVGQSLIWLAQSGIVLKQTLVSKRRTFKIMEKEKKNPGEQLYYLAWWGKRKDTFVSVLTHLPDSSTYASGAFDPERSRVLRAPVSLSRPLGFWSFQISLRWCEELVCASVTGLFCLSAVTFLVHCCEKYTHLSKLKDWAQRHVEYSGSCKIRCLVSRDTQSGYNKHCMIAHKSPPPVPHCLSTAECTSFSYVT
jgi:hypothetical protein